MRLSVGIEDSKIGITQDWIVKDQEADSTNDLLNYSYNILGINSLWTSPTIQAKCSPFITLFEDQAIHFFDKFNLKTPLPNW